MTREPGAPANSTADQAGAAARPEAMAGSSAGPMAAAAPPPMAAAAPPPAAADLPAPVGPAWQSRATGDSHWFAEDALRDFAPEQPGAPGGWSDLLEPGERILWQGRPGSSPVWTELFDMQTLFGAAFAGFAIFMMIQLGAEPGPGGLPVNPLVLFGLPFLGVGLQFLGGRVLWDAFQRRHSYYTLTDRAAYIASDALGRRRIERFVLAGMRPRLEGGQPGSIWFGPQAGQSQPRKAAAGFRMVADAGALFRVISGLSGTAPTTTIPAPPLAGGQ